MESPATQPEPDPQVPPALGELAERVAERTRRDRDAVVEILHAAMAVGARVELPASGAAGAAGQGPAAPDGPGDGEPDEPPAGGELGKILAAWRLLQDRGRTSVEVAPEFARLARRLLGLGENLLAYDIVTDGLRLAPRDRSLRQIQGLTLARTGAVGAAHAVLAALHGEGHSDEETLGLLARTEKDLGLRAGATGARVRHLTRSLELYRESFERHRSLWTGINAATVSAFLAASLPDAEGLPLAEQARQLAAEVEALGLAGLDPQDPRRFWTVATLGEANLIRGRLDEAARRYEEATRLAWDAKRYGDLGTTRRQAMSIVAELKSPAEDVDRIRNALRVPGVAIMVGHMVDRPDRPSPRFPEGQVGPVREAIRRRLVREDIRIGYASAACGADLLFLDELLKLGGEGHVVVPYSVERFIEDSVAIVPGGEWDRLFRSVLSRSEVLVASKQRLAVGGVSYDYTSLILHGLSVLHAEQLGAELHHLAVWDGRPGDGPGGTASTILRWQDAGRRMILFDPMDPGDDGRILDPPSLAAPQPHPAWKLPESRTDTAQAKVVGILFGDVKGFSGLSEDQIPPFVEHFLGLVARCLADMPQPPLKKNTWGDGIYLAFDDIRTTGLFALELCRRVKATDWESLGLPAGLTLRIGLHAGPVYLCIDPVTESPNCMGTHVSHGARIEPATPPGQVYASREFAALAAADDIAEFRCQYVGQTPWAKGYGIFPTYHIRQA